MSKARASLVLAAMASAALPRASSALAAMGSDADYPGELGPSCHGELGAGGHGELAPAMASSSPTQVARPRRAAAAARRDGERGEGEEEEEDDIWGPCVRDRRDEVYVFIYICNWVQVVSILFSDIFVENE